MPRTVRHAPFDLALTATGLAFSSGTAAVDALGRLLEPGAHILSVSDIYGGTKRYFTKIICNYGVETSFAPMSDLAATRSMFKTNTKMVWIESPTNPTLTVIDIAAVAKIAHSLDPNIVVVVDNTFLTPYLQRPLDLGADVVLHSATKFLNGHCDVVMGLLATNSPRLYSRLLFVQNATGAVPSAFDCYLLARGMRTLHLRMDRHSSNALRIAAFLATHPRVERVFYPGLATHPQHEIAKRQHRAHGGVVSFVLRGGDLARTCKFSKSTRIFVLAESLGGVESLIDVPAVMTHGAVPPHERAELGITDGFVRLSVGIEDCDDLIADLARALDAAYL